MDSGLAQAPTPQTTTGTEGRLPMAPTEAEGLQRYMGTEYAVNNAQGGLQSGMESFNPDAAGTRTFDTEKFNQGILGAMAKYNPDQVPAFVNQRERTRLAKRADERSEREIESRLKTAELTRDNLEFQLQNSRNLAPSQRREMELKLRQADYKMAQMVAAPLYTMLDPNPGEAELKSIKGYLNQHIGVLQKAAVGDRIDSVKEVTYDAKTGRFVITGAKGGQAIIDKRSVGQFAGVKAPEVKHGKAKLPGEDAGDAVYTVLPDGSVRFETPQVPGQVAQEPIGYARMAALGDLFSDTDWRRLAREAGVPYNEAWAGKGPANAELLGEELARRLTPAMVKNAGIEVDWNALDAAISAPKQPRQGISAATPAGGPAPAGVPPSPPARSGLKAAAGPPSVTEEEVAPAQKPNYGGRQKSAGLEKARDIYGKEWDRISTMDVPLEAKRAWLKSNKDKMNPRDVIRAEEYLVRIQHPGLW